nr:hypothetical protein [Acidobacteriota bacterium]
HKLGFRLLMVLISAEAAACHFKLCGGRLELVWDSGLRVFEMGAVQGNSAITPFCSVGRFFH